MSSLHTFKDAGAWEVPAIREIARMCKYVADDGAVAAYFHIPRHEVQAVRAKMGKSAPAPVDATAKSEELVNASDRMTRIKAEEASARFLERCNMLFRRFAKANGLTIEKARELQLQGYRA